MTLTPSPKLTPAQERARAWLPEDGSWRDEPGIMSAALWSLSQAWYGSVQREWGDYGKDGGEGYRWRFTAEGIARSRCPQGRS